MTNTSCAHVCVVVDGDSVFLNVCATRGRARDLLQSGHSGPKTVADLMAAIVPRPCAVCTNSLSSQWTQISFGFHVSLGLGARLFAARRRAGRTLGPTVGPSLECLPHLMVPSVSRPGLMTHSVAPLSVLGRRKPHGQGQLSRHRTTKVSTSLEPRSHDSRMSEVSHRLMTASRTSVIHGSFPGGDAGPHGPAPLSPRELLK